MSDNGAEFKYAREYYFSFFGTGADGQGFFFGEFALIRRRLDQTVKILVEDYMEEKHDLQGCSLMGIFDNGVVSVADSPWDVIDSLEKGE